MSTGFGAVSEALKRSAESRSSSDGPQSWLMSWDKKGETKILRFVTDDVVVAGFHSFTLCKDGKRRDFVCPENLPDHLSDKKRDCLICRTHTRKDRNGDDRPVRPSEKVVGLAVERTVEKSGHKVVSFDDVLWDKPVEVKIDGKEEVLTNLPKVWLVSQSISNFWNTLVVLNNRYGTIQDRDFEITRSGEGPDTTYTIIPFEPMDDISGPEDIEERYGKAKLATASIDDYLTRLSSERYFAHLGGGDSSQGQDSTEDFRESAPAAAPASSASASNDLSSLRERVSRWNS